MIVTKALHFEKLVASGDLAPTLDLLNVEQPEDMTGESLIKH
ncbi:hypothetical protein ACVNP0_00870 [Staphylococcus aureus]